MATATSSNRAGRAKPDPNRPFRTYDAAIRYLFSMTDYEQLLRVRYNRDTFSLDRMHELLRQLGNPHQQLRAVHIAGTKGKGSTVAMLSEMLMACGLKVGVYTSPHIMDVRERLCIGHDMISQAAMTRLVCQVQPIIEGMGADRPTFFEAITAMAFLYFADQQVDVAVIETGLGGRLDSTNVLTPVVCGLTSISMDHMHQLGPTLSAIAAEKAGILKADVPAVSVPQAAEVERVLREHAHQKNARLMVAGKDIDFSYRFESSRASGPHTRVCLTTDSSQFEHLAVPMLGEHQALNCGLALALLDQLKVQGFKIDDRLAIDGLARTFLPGRMEMVCNDPRILADGAHNSASVAALMRAIGQNIPYDSMVVIFGCAVDKDIPGIMDQLTTGADKIIFTRAANSRAAKPQDLADLYEERTGKTAQIAESVEDALNTARSAVSREDVICVTGSFYLVGEAKTCLLKQR